MINVHLIVGNFYENLQRLNYGFRAGIQFFATNRSSPLILYAYQNPRLITSQKGVLPIPYPIGSQTYLQSLQVLALPFHQLTLNSHLILVQLQLSRHTLFICLSRACSLYLYYFTCGVSIQSQYTPSVVILTISSQTVLLGTITTMNTKFLAIIVQPQNSHILFIFVSTSTLVSNKARRSGSTSSAPIFVFPLLGSGSQTCSSNSQQGQVWSMSKYLQLVFSPHLYGYVVVCTVFEYHNLGVVYSTKFYFASVRSPTKFILNQTIY